LLVFLIVTRLTLGQKGRVALRWVFQKANFLALAIVTESLSFN
jgi:hypothetical protein